MTSLSLSSIKVPVFEGKKFEHWRLQMENIFICQDIWEIMKDGYVEPTEGVVQTPEKQTNLTANRKNNSKATYILHQGIHESLMDRFIYIKQAKAAWDGLVSYYTGSDKVKKMEVTETISEFFPKTLNLVNEMKSNGDTVEDSAVVEKNLRSLPEKYEEKVTSIEECNTVATMSLNELLGSLQAYEQRLCEKTAAAKPIEEALQSQVTWSNKQGNSKSGGRPNNGGYQGRNNTGGRFNTAGYQGRKPLDLSTVQCYNCGIYGHFATTCTKPRRTTANNY
ncbi:uncharacterized protein LOC113272485 [Papaver somniferum]|uniref:uncharacterized protein LOC113272485 n=1 Tax=Papaver somniferum TaxID=3469 RepID=UPI000E701039|nr:uncharacterized protein LOC113272485 [Papaver somniferum]